MPTYFVREWREHLGLDRSDLLDAIAREKGEGWLSESALKKIEIGETTRPHSPTLNAIAQALGVTRRELQSPPADRAAEPAPKRATRSRRQPGLPYLRTLPSPDAPDIDDEERERRQGEILKTEWLLREAFDMRDRSGSRSWDAFPGGLRATKERQKALAVLQSAPVEVLHALLFVVVAAATAKAIESDADDPVTYEAARMRLGRLVADATRVGELVWLADEFVGGLIGRQMTRETDAAGLRAYQRAVEAYELVHAPVLHAWAGAAGFWDEPDDRNLFADVAPFFNVFDEVFGARIRATQDRRRAQPE